MYRYLGLFGFSIGLTAVFVYSTQSSYDSPTNLKHISMIAQMSLWCYSKSTLMLECPIIARWWKAMSWSFWSLFTVRWEESIPGGSVWWDADCSCTSKEWLTVLLLYSVQLQHFKDYDTSLGSDTILCLAFGEWTCLLVCSMHILRQKTLQFSKSVFSSVYWHQMGTGHMGIRLISITPAMQSCYPQPANWFSMLIRFLLWDL